MIHARGKSWLLTGALLAGLASAGLMEQSPRGQFLPLDNELQRKQVIEDQETRPPLDSPVQQNHEVSLEVIDGEQMLGPEMQDFIDDVMQQRTVWR